VLEAEGFLGTLVREEFVCILCTLGAAAEKYAMSNKPPTQVSLSGCIHLTLNNAVGRGEKKKVCTKYCFQVSLSGVSAFLRTLNHLGFVRQYYFC